MKAALAWFCTFEIKQINYSELMDRITKAIRTQVEKSNEMEHSVPLYLTSSFCFDTAEKMRAAFADESNDNIYSRFSNPNVDEFTDKICALEGAEAGYATASGMSAVFGSFMALMKSGDHLLACRSLFGSTHNIITKYLYRYGIEYSYVDAAADISEWEKSVKSNTKMIFIESPTNPGLDILDIKALAELAHKNNIILNVKRGLLQEQ